MITQRQIVSRELPYLASLAKTRHADPSYRMSVADWSMEDILLRNDATFSFGPDAVRILLQEAVQCQCGTMHYFVINRNGRTRCSECDYFAQMEAPCKTT